MKANAEARAVGYVAGTRAALVERAANIARLLLRRAAQQAAGVGGKSVEGPVAPWHTCWAGGQYWLRDRRMAGAA